MIKSENESVYKHYYYSFIRYNNNIKLYEVVGVHLIELIYIGYGSKITEERYNVIHTGSEESCIEFDKGLFPEKYF